MTRYEEFKIFNDYQKAMIEEDKKQVTQKDKCLVFVKNVVSEDTFEEILQVIEESEHTYNFKLTDKPVGEFQKDGLYFLEGIYINQTCDGGYSGDSFAGTVSIKFDSNKYLQFSYSM